MAKPVTRTILAENMSKMVELRRRWSSGEASGSESSSQRSSQRSSPRATIASTSPLAHDEPTESAKAPLRVLVADDNESLRSLIAVVLKSLGDVEVVLAVDGEDGLQKLDGKSPTYSATVCMTTSRSRSPLLSSYTLAGRDNSSRR